ncbi:MAG TPA: radical SAM protein [Candidatus Kapabacteria bacterium]|nr:radical SAM protein [Candidatus Kapabacteria bacterium]
MILLINPQSARRNFRFPLSILAIAASVEGKYDTHILDENFDKPLEQLIEKAVREYGIKYVGFTVMPGPQLQRAVPLSKYIRQRFPDIKIIWGGYFPTLHSRAALRSDYVDYVVRGQGDICFPKLIDALEHRQPVDTIESLSWKNGSEIVNNSPGHTLDPNALLPLPYHRINVPRYLARTALGMRTSVHHSSVGCPFLCGFCAVAGIYQGRWMGRDPDMLAEDVLRQQREWGIDSMLFYDNNFFMGEKRTARFAEHLVGKNISWWGEGRPDTVMHYSDETLRLMRDGGCKIIFFGAETSSTDMLDTMHKGGTQTPDTVLDLCERFKQFDIVPELSFILGSPSDTMDKDIERDIRFIRKAKEINPRAEIIIYVYSPVFFDDATMYQEALQRGFHFPQTLDDWVSPQWAQFDMRKNPTTPWLKPHHIRRIKNFEATLDGAFPTSTNYRILPWQRRILKALGGWRYKVQLYDAPYEIRIAKKM